MVAATSGGHEGVFHKVARRAVAAGHTAHQGVGRKCDEVVGVGVEDGVDRAVAIDNNRQAVNGAAKVVAQGVGPVHKVVAGLGIGVQHHAVEVGHRVTALHIAGQGVGGQAVDGVLVHGEHGRQGGVAHGAHHQGVERAHQVGVIVIPALEGVAVLGHDGQGVAQEVLHRVGARHGTHRVAVALVVLHGEGYIIYIGVEVDGDDAVTAHQDGDRVAGDLITQSILNTQSNQTVGVAGDMVAGVGLGDDGDRAVGHDGVDCAIA